MEQKQLAMCLSLFYTTKSSAGYRIPSNSHFWVMACWFSTIEIYISAYKFVWHYTHCRASQIKPYFQQQVILTHNHLPFSFFLPLNTALHYQHITLSYIIHAAKLLNLSDTLSCFALSIHSFVICSCQALHNGLPYSEIWKKIILGM
jgi:hypothetical protein